MNRKIENRWVVPILITLIILAFLIVWRGIARSHPHEVTCDQIIELRSLAKSAGSKRSIAWGYFYGPLERREGIMLWSECGEYFIEHEVYGPPASSINSRGPLLESHLITLPEPVFEGLGPVIEKVLSEAEDCVIVIP
jgi:hypothetical protein